MKLVNLLFSLLVLNLYAQEGDPIVAYTRPLKIPVPDSLTNGVLVELYELPKTANGINFPIKGLRPSVRLIDAYAGLADWRENFTFRSVYSKPFIFQISGFLLIRESREYTFKLQGYQVGKIWIDGKEVAHKEAVEGKFTDVDFSLPLKQGFHSFVIKGYSENKPNTEHELSLAWMYALQDKSFDWAPQEMFYVSKNAVKGLRYNPTGNNETKELSSGAPDYTNSLHPAYTIFDLHDENFMPKVGGMDFKSNGDLVLCTWDSLGQVFLVKNATSKDKLAIKPKRIALGLAEPLGLKVVDDTIYVLQKQELTKLIDHDGDDIIDEYRTVCSSWGATGNFHEFAFGLVYKEGYFYFSLATAIQPGGKSTIPQNKDRGKCIKVSKNGDKVEVLASGLRTPNGIGLGVDDEIFIADNQGDWLPSCKIVHATKGDFFGNYSVELYEIGKFEEKPPVVWLPQGEIGNSASQPGLLTHGPYKGQMIHGDVTHGGLKRVFVEKIDGQYQGAVFPFSQGFNAGINRWCYGPDGAIYVGGVGSNGNWGQYAKKWFGLQRMSYTGNSVFEILALRSRSNGFEIEFTEPVHAKYGNKLSEFNTVQWRYEPTMQYGGPKLDVSKPEVISASWSKDRKKVFLEITGLQKKHVIFISIPKDWTSASGNKIWANKGWYTLNKISEIPGVVTGARKTIATPIASSKPSAAVAKPEPTDAEIRALGPKLIDDGGCKQCHAMNEKVLGPSFKQINDKYNSDPATLAKLTEKVYKGGSGVWGEQAMGANTHLSKDDIKKMVRWILMQ